MAGGNDQKSGEKPIIPKVISSVIRKFCVLILNLIDRIWLSSKIDSLNFALVPQRFIFIHRMGIGLFGIA